MWIILMLLGLSVVGCLGRFSLLWYRGVTLSDVSGAELNSWAYVGSRKYAGLFWDGEVSSFEVPGGLIARVGFRLHPSAFSLPPSPRMQEFVLHLGVPGRFGWVKISIWGREISVNAPFRVYDSKECSQVVCQLLSQLADFSNDSRLTALLCALEGSPKRSLHTA